MTALEILAWGIALAICTPLIMFAAIVALCTFSVIGTAIVAMALSLADDIAAILSWMIRKVKGNVK